MSGTIPCIASYQDRIYAFLIDVVLLAVLTVALRIFLIWFGLVDTSDERLMKSLDSGLFKAIAFFLYYPLTAILWGASPGKMCIGLKVKADDGSDLSILRILIRETFGRWLSPLVLGHFWPFLNKRHKASWDYFAGSIVVRDAPPQIVDAASRNRLIR